MTGNPAESTEQVLAHELARGDATIAMARPILRHLLANEDHGLFNDQILANLRGTLGHVALQLLLAQAVAAGAGEPREFAADRQDDLARAFYEDAGFLSFAHAQALEAQLAGRLQQRNAIDPVLSPLVQELVASRDADMAALAMAFLAAQARFIQQHRRMELPLHELPGDLFHKALMVLLSHPGAHSQAAEQAVDSLREGFEESRGRLGLISRLIMGMGKQAVRALAIDHAGLAMFATALSMASEQDRELAILSLGGQQNARLALALRSAGLKNDAIEEQLLFFTPDCVLPDGFEALLSDRAAALLTNSNPVAAL